jgi:hypothetical protein
MPATPEHGELGDAEVGRLYLRNLSPEALIALGAGLGGLFFVVALGLTSLSHWEFPVLVSLVVGALCFVPPTAAWRILGRGVRLWRLLGEGVRGLRGSGSDRRRLPGTRSPTATFAAADREKDAEWRLLEAIERHGELTAVRAALETGLTVAEADEVLFGLANRGHLEVRVEKAKILYALP